MSRYLDKIEEKDKEEVIDLLGRQIEVERKLVSLYEETEEDIKSSAVRHLLRMIQLDSKKHIEICQLVIEVLRGEDLLQAEKEEIIEGLQRHIELEKVAVDRANKILKNVWIAESEGLKGLIKRWRDDEKKHHDALKKLTGKTFFRTPRGIGSLFITTEDLEERYRKRKKFRGW